MNKSIFVRCGLATLIVLLVFLLSWLLTPPAVFSQEEIPVFSADECPVTSGDYGTWGSGHSGYTGSLVCRYYKESADNQQNNVKNMWITYYTTPDEALENLKVGYLNDDNLSKFSCESYECDNFERMLLDKTDNSYMGYFIGKYTEPYYYSLEQCFVYDNFSVTIFISGNLFSGIDQALAEMEELEVTAKMLVEEPRETVFRETSGDDCGCDEATEEPTEASSEVDDETSIDESSPEYLAGLISLLGADLESLSDWEGWEGLSDTQKENLIKIIDRLDIILENQKQQEVIRQAAEIVAQEVDNFHHIFNHFAIASVAVEYGDKAAQSAYEEIYIGRDWLSLGSLYLDKAYYGPISRSEVENMLLFVGSDEDPDELAQETLEYYYFNEVTPEVLLWQSYCNTSVDLQATLAEQHHESMQQLREDYQFFVDKGVYFDFSQGGKVDTALWNLLQDADVFCP
jgi:hypothetical protein